MSRRLLLGLQQVLLRAPTGPLGSPHTCKLVHTLPSTQPETALCSPGSRPFAASAHQSQATQAGASSTSLLENGRHQSLLESPQQQESIPADQYSYSGRLTEQYHVHRKPVFAVVELGPTQFKVTPDDLVYSEKLTGVDIGDQVSLNRVLLLGNTATTVIGRPHVPGATVTAVIEVILELVGFSTKESHWAVTAAIVFNLIGCV